MYQLIICEKPNAAKKIADALADNKAIKKYERHESVIKIKTKIINLSFFLINLY